MHIETAHEHTTSPTTGKIIKQLADGHSAKACSANQTEGSIVSRALEQVHALGPRAPTNLIRQDPGCSLHIPTHLDPPRLGEIQAIWAPCPHVEPLGGNHQ